MKSMNLIKKPFVTLIVVVFVVAAIIFIEMQKPSINFANNATTEDKNSKYPKAPDFVGIDKWINSEPLKMESLKGKVVLVDFWTYTCINCIRTLPYLKDWDAKYRDKGLVIVGVHSPEFEFEKKYENVLKAVNDYQIKYAVAQDNHYATWSAYQNRYWPHKFLIDIDGYTQVSKLFPDSERQLAVLKIMYAELQSHMLLGLAYKYFNSTEQTIESTISAFSLHPELKKQYNMLCRLQKIYSIRLLRLVACSALSMLYHSRIILRAWWYHMTRSVSV